MKIVLTGASGYLGTVLAPFLSALEHEMVLVARRELDYPLPARARWLQWDGENLGDWAREIDGADAVINLAGRSVNCRYSEKNRREILESRLQTTRIVAQSIGEAKNPPRVWLNAASATIYHDERGRDMDETSGVVGEGFSVEVCKAWEGALFESNLLRTRRVALRMSMIFGRSAPVFEVFERLTKLGLGGPQGDGGQYVSWIHERDCLRALQFLLENETLSGPVNVCAPHPIPNREWTRVLRRIFSVPFGLPAPRPAMEIGAILMQTETELALKSHRVVPKRLLSAGFKFDFPHWRLAAPDIIDSPQRREGAKNLEGNQ
ncbi:MAG: TIGR01777 family oxidoreductase [Armatimonadetes bacterium]|nr:TIGR01777 family oxidoreductase [Armatimonadota bacterium]